MFRTGTISCVVFCLAASGRALPAAADPVVVSIDAGAARVPISPLIYGLGFGTAADLAALNVPINRMGGDTTSTYSWRSNAWNLAADYYYESYPQPTAAAGGVADDFVAANLSGNAASLLTVPMTGWVAKLGAGRRLLPSFSVARYGAQCAVDRWDSDAGDGLKPDCATPIAGNAPTDAYVRDTPAVEAGWIRHLVGRWGNAAGGGVTFYALDNEPSIWFGTHRDIAPTGLHAAAYRDTSLAYAAMVHATDPTALVVAPEEWGWDGFLYSGYDQQYASLHGWSSRPDRQSQTGGMDYIPWLLTQWKAHGHPVDVLSVHFYPQGGEDGDDDSAAMQALRNRSTRQLWDPAYVSESWINAPVNLIPRLHSWVAQYYYAGTPVAITEYNWGDEANINGATTQADLLGIFGRQGLGIATRWTVPDPATPTYQAIRMYRNYDGHHSAFGDTSVAATGSDPDSLAVFAATRSVDGALTIIAVNKVAAATPVSLQVRNFTAGSAARVYQLTAAGPIAALPDAPLGGGTIHATLPAQSVTTFVLPAAGLALAQPPVAAMSAAPLNAYAQNPGGTVNYLVNFASAGSAPAPGATIAGYRWDFGDGAAGTGAAIQHVYHGYGVYTAQLTVTGSNGLVSTAAASVTVLPRLPPVTGCTLRYQVTSTWDGGYGANVVVGNTGAVSVPFWVLRWQFTGGEAAYSMWNASWQQAGASLLVLPAAWTQSIASGGSVSFGFDATAPQPPRPPAAVTLNGHACTAG